MMMIPIPSCAFRLSMAAAVCAVATVTGLQMQNSASSAESSFADIVPLLRLYATSSVTELDSQSALVSRAVASLEAEDRLAGLTADGAWVRSSPKQAAEFKKEQGNRSSSAERFKYGFYLHTFSQPAACIHLLRMVRKNYPEEPVYIMSDGGKDFSGLCEKIGNCNFQWRPPANDRWNPKPFFERFREAALWLDSKYVVMLEPDNAISGKIRYDPTDDAGGLKDANPAFGLPIRKYVEKQGQLATGNENFVLKWDRFGLAGGSYFRSAALLDAFKPETINWHQLRKLDGKRVWSSDVAMPLSLAIHGYSYYPWKDVTQLAVEKKWGKPEKKPAFRHYGRDEPLKPFYNANVGLMDKNLVKDYVTSKPVGKVFCQGCVWDSDAVCLEQNPIACPTGAQDSGPRK